MTEEKNYISKKGDIVWIDFDPSAGKEIQKRRPGLVVSRYDFNRETMFAVICPITPTIRNLPTRYFITKQIRHYRKNTYFSIEIVRFQLRKLKKLNPCLYKIWLKSIKLSNIYFNHSNELLFLMQRVHYYDFLFHIL